MSAQFNTKTYQLNNSKTIPAVALGTWLATDNDCVEAVSYALKNGYRHIDTAAHYGCEKEVGQGIRESGIPREEIFLTTKVWNFDHKNVKGAFEDSLSRLGLDYVDMYLLHWPKSLDPATEFPYKDWDFVDTYKEMQKLLDTGKVKSIGISNFTVAKARKLLADPGVTVKPVVNQIEGHPLLPQPELTKWFRDQNIVIECYCPLGSSETTLVKTDEIVDIAKRNNVDVGQVLISWGVQRNTVVLPKSTKKDRIISNLKTFTLSDEDMHILDTLTDKYGVQRAVPDDVFED
ncbi:putative aldo-keto reductase [Metschnikowia bicuspidata var. bicuspidata NRRL YB-4993]|uniref:2-dehydropantolactone reductase n=1 Tax=Metschnikowia bicuspidata var. bicuspidata NRRL YB-4993 TaxID=869754 RepID=A0A1A0H5P6_9ASCO|nr:putative aldo-keto reductase [Metschnikowia bicuspidata var. bicuspidata NRRL YB-4993]OBA19409.1 putative aldo-keto reductase [Metschnikowia bicuspidata var. bicuspidata NRRL YB-4993]